MVRDRSSNSPIHRLDEVLELLSMSGTLENTISVSATCVSPSAASKKASTPSGPSSNTKRKASGIFLGRGNSFQVSDAANFEDNSMDPKSSQNFFRSWQNACTFAPGLLAARAFA